MDTERSFMNILCIISSNDPETVYNAMRLANVAVKKGMTSALLCLGKEFFLNKSARADSMSWSRSINMKAIFMSEGCA
jgi:hypothetical protein